MIYSEPSSNPKITKQKKNRSEAEEDRNQQQQEQQRSSHSICNLPSKYRLGCAKKDMRGYQMLEVEKNLCDKTLGGLTPLKRSVVK